MVRNWICGLFLFFALGGCGAAPADPMQRGPRPPGAFPTNPSQGAPTAPAGAGSAGRGFDNPGLAVVPIGPEPPSDGSCNQDVDIVFVLDVSGSMIPPLTTLEREVSLVDEALKTKNLPSPAHFGLVLFVDDILVMNTGMAYADVEAVKTELRAQIQLTNQTPPRQLVVADANNLTWPENGLDGLFEAATKFQWRPAEKTLRTIIMITDASFWDLTAASSGHDSEVNNGIFPDHKSMHDYDSTIAALREQKIWVNTFAAKTGGPPDGMMSPPSHGEWRGTTVNVGVGYFEPYKGKPSIAEQTGGFALDIDEVFDGKISLATPINEAVETQRCEMYPG